MSQVPGHGESPVVTERLIIIGIKIRVHVIQLPISLLLWEQDIVWGHIVWEFPQISGFISRKVRFHSLQIKALLRYTICWDWGMDYVRFAGNQTGTKHQGIRWGGSIGILPVDTEKGISATVSIDRMSMDKKLSNAIISLCWN